MTELQADLLIAQFEELNVSFASMDAWLSYTLFYLEMIIIFGIVYYILRWLFRIISSWALGW